MTVEQNIFAVQKYLGVALQSQYLGCSTKEGRNGFVPVSQIIYSNAP